MLSRETSLISKTQYKRSEKGEFHEVAARNLEETIALVLNYPWDTERSLASIELSCPSVTIEHSVGSYLKIGPYFSGKFSLYYLTTKNRVYVKIADTLEDVCLGIRAFFELNGKLLGFDQYSFTIKPYTHFRTNTFEYIVNRKGIVNFFRFPVYMATLIILMTGLKSIEQPLHSNTGAAVFMVLFCLLLWSPLIYLFFNYLSVDKNDYIQISRGHNEFFYGTVDSKKMYSKQDIVEINAYGVYYSRSLWRECEIFMITFKNGAQIQFTSLLISGDKLRQKFPDHHIIDNKKGFPRFQSSCAVAD